MQTLLEQSQLYSGKLQAETTGRNCRKKLLTDDDNTQNDCKRRVTTHLQKEVELHRKFQETELDLIIVISSQVVWKKYREYI